MGTRVDYQLPEHLTIANVQGLHEELEALIADQNNDEIVIHGEGVTRADTAGIQLLLALSHAAKERQIALSWDSPSDKLKTAATVLGLDGPIGIH